MGSVATQEGLACFLGIPKNAQEVNRLVEDTRDALMDYQVWSPKRPVLIIADICSDFAATGHLQRRLSADRESYPLLVPCFVVTCK